MMMKVCSLCKAERMIVPELAPKTKLLFVSVKFYNTYFFFSQTNLSSDRQT